MKFAHVVCCIIADLTGKVEVVEGCAFHDVWETNVGRSLDRLDLASRLMPEGQRTYTMWVSP